MAPSSSPGHAQRRQQNGHHLDPLSCWVFEMFGAASVSDTLPRRWPGVAGAALLASLCPLSVAAFLFPPVTSGSGACLVGTELPAAWPWLSHPSAAVRQLPRAGVASAAPFTAAVPPVKLAMSSGNSWILGVPFVCDSCFSTAASPVPGFLCCCQHLELPILPQQCSSPSSWLQNAIRKLPFAMQSHEQMKINGLVFDFLLFVLVLLVVW